MMRVPWGLAALTALLLVAGCVSTLPGADQIEIAPPAALQVLHDDLEARLAQHPDDPELLFLTARVLLRMGELGTAEQRALEAGKQWRFDAPLSELLGRIYLAQNKRFRALTAFTRAVDFDPDLLSAYVNLAITQNLLEQRDEALLTLQEAVRREPRYFPAQYRLALTLFEKGDLEAAATATVEARRIRPDDLDARLLEIRIAKAQGQLTVAAFLANEAIKLHADAPAPRRELVDIHMQRQEWQPALEVLEGMARLGPLAPDDQVARAEVLRSLGRNGESAALIAAVLSRHPDHPGALLARGRALLLGNDPQGALKAVERAVEEDPKSARAYYWKALVHFRLGELTKGNAALGVAEGITPTDPHVRLLRIRRLLAARKLGEAAPLLNQYLAEFPADGNALLVKSELLTLLGDFNGAERHLDELVAGESEAALRFARARLAYLRGAFRAVLEHTAPVVEKGSAAWQMAYLHAAALGRLGRTADALRVVTPYLSGTEGEGTFHRLAGDLHRLAGAPKAAEEVLLKGLGKFPRNADLLERLTRMAIEEGRWDRARDWLEGAIEVRGRWQAVFLERLSLAYGKLGEAAKSTAALAKYLAATDPLLGEGEQVEDQGVLFGSAFPAVGYGIQPPRQGR